MIASTQLQISTSDLFYLQDTQLTLFFVLFIILIILVIFIFVILLIFILGFHRSFIS